MAPTLWRDRLARLAEEGGTVSAYARGVCIGIDSGSVISGSVGSPSTRRLDYAVLGDVVSNAIKLGEAAEKNQILVAEPLYEEMAPLFLCNATERTVMTAASRPVSVHSLVALRQEVAVGGLDERPDLARTLVMKPPGQNKRDRG